MDSSDGRSGVWGRGLWAEAGYFGGVGKVHGRTSGEGEETGRLYGPPGKQ